MFSISFYLMHNIYVITLSFFVSSRRRHTRWPRDWSSDVCSSDLAYHNRELPMHTGYERLAILADKAGEDPEVIRLCERGLEQGWAGNWARRIEKAWKRAEAKRGG